MVMNFKIFDEESKWEIGRFEIENLKVIDEKGKKRISLGRIQTYLDGALYQGGIETWAHSNVKDEELFTSVLNAYLRDDVETYHYGDEWDFFKELKLTGGSGPAEKILQYVAGAFEEYALILAVPERRYYIFEDDACMLCNEEGGIITDIDMFLMNELYKDIVHVLKEETPCIYKGYDFDCIVKEYGGPEGFIKAFDENN